MRALPLALAADKTMDLGKEAMVKATGTELEKRIAEACSNKPWGASSTMLSEIAQSTYDYQDYPVVMSQVWKRVHESSRNWRACHIRKRAAPRWVTG